MVREFKKKQKSKGAIEWDFILGFIALLALWLLVGHQLLNNYANGAPLIGNLEEGDTREPHPLGAYSIFIVIYSVMFFMLGASVHKGFLAVFIGLLGYFILDIWSPPIMVPSGILLQSPLFITLGSLFLMGSIIFFIIANRLELPWKVYIFGGFVLLGMMLLVLGVNHKLSGDPFVQTSCTGEGMTSPPNTYCVKADGNVLIPGHLSLSTDAFLYLFFRNVVGIPHFISWLVTYMLIPTLTIILFAFFMTREQMGKAIVDGWQSS